VVFLGATACKLGGPPRPRVPGHPLAADTALSMLDFFCFPLFPSFHLWLLLLWLKAATSHLVSSIFLSCPEHLPLPSAPLNDTVNSFAANLKSGTIENSRPHHISAGNFLTTGDPGQPKELWFCFSVHQRKSLPRLHAPRNKPGRQGHHFPNILNYRYIAIFLSDPHPAFLPTSWESLRLDKWLFRLGSSRLYATLSRIPPRLMTG
jgi:hypothetical protein